MPFIAFLGCDGSGKSAVIQGVAQRLAAAGRPVTLGHWRPHPFAPATVRSTVADDPHGQIPRGSASSILKLAWLWCNWWVAWLLHLRRDSRRGVVLFDRYHGDLLVDPKRYRYGGPMALARFASRCMPQPDLVIFLDAPADVLLGRKQEVGREALDSGCAAYLEFGLTRAAFRRVDATPELPQVIDAAFELVVAP